MYYYSREKEEKRKHRRERERSERFFSFWLRATRLSNPVVIKSSRARTPRAMNSYPVVIIIAKKKRELSSVTLSLSLCSFSLVVLFLLLLFVFTFHPKRGVLDTKINSLLLSLSYYGRKYTLIIGSNAYDCVIKGLHEYFIKNRRIVFLSSSPRVVSSSSIREREREREKRRARKNDGRKFCIYKIRETWKKNKSLLLLLFCRHSREREREIGSETRCIITQFCQIKPVVC